MQKLDYNNLIIASQNFPLILFGILHQERTPEKEKKRYPQLAMKSSKLKCPPENPLGIAITTLHPTTILPIQMYDEKGIQCM